MNKLFIKLYFFCLNFSSETKLRIEKTIRSVWHRGIKLQWYRLWIRKDEFHGSLDMDSQAIIGMDEKKFRKYSADLVNRRRIAHEKDL